MKTLDSFLIHARASGQVIGFASPFWLVLMASGYLDAFLRLPGVLGGLMALSVLLVYPYAQFLLFYRSPNKHAEWESMKKRSGCGVKEGIMVLPKTCFAVLVLIPYYAGRISGIVYRLFNSTKKGA